MDVETFDSNKNGKLTKVFFAVEDGKVVSVSVGNQVVSAERGYQLYVRYYVADQIDKCDLIMDGLSLKLKLKEGEELVIPTEEEQKEREIEKLERKLKELRN